MILDLVYTFCRVVYLSRSLVLYLGSQNEDLNESYLAELIHDEGIHIFDYLIPEEDSYFN
jgi:hypothetical protein